MGTWGVNVRDDDTFFDVHSDYIERFNAGESHDVIVAALVNEFGNDLEDYVGVWLGIARAQWDCGALTDVTLSNVRQIVESERDLDRWGPPGDKNRAARDRALRQFLAKLAEPNPRPKKPRKARIVKPIFQPGDCLSIRLPDGDYAAAFVTAAPPEEPRPGADTHGINIVALLDYKDSQPPAASVFEKRQILKLTHHKWDGKRVVLMMTAAGFRSYRNDFTVVGHSEVRADDPTTSNTFTGWDFANQIIYQRRWDSGDHS